VTEIVGLQSYRLQLPISWKIHNVFHTSKLTTYITPAFPSQFDLIITPELTETPATLQNIILHRKLRNKTLFLTLLENQSPEDAKWVPLDVLQTFYDPQHVFAEYKNWFPFFWGGVML
jgi:hypothetical protein